ncbi:MAG TPA: WD40 repeat domain-containing protein, partial [Polyangia bacterium]|nr:WD40 repeat domain-containing protein [Polyangia bacterium]
MLLKLRRGPRWKATLPDFAGALAWSPDSRQIAAATLAGPVIVFDGERGDELARHRGHEQGALAVAWSPDGARLASGGQDGRIEVHERGGASRSLDGGGSWVEHLAWSAGGECLASAAGRVLRVWTPGGALASEVTGYESTITSL